MGLAVAAGLLMGKPVGILLFAVVAVRLKLARLPEGVGWGVVLGGAFLAGIGFANILIVKVKLAGDVLHSHSLTGERDDLTASQVRGALRRLQDLGKPSTLVGREI